MGDRPLSMMDDIERMQKLMNDLKFENKQMEDEIEKELGIIDGLESNVEATKIEIKMNKEACRQQNEEMKLLRSQYNQNIHNCNSLQEACDILSEQEKNLIKQLDELRLKGQATRQKHKDVADHYEALYKQYVYKYEKRPLVHQLRLKEMKLAALEQKYGKAGSETQDTRNTMSNAESDTVDVNTFPVFKNPRDFIIMLAEIKVASGKMLTDLKKEVQCCRELEVILEKKLEAKRWKEESMEKKKIELDQLRIIKEKMEQEALRAAEDQRKMEQRQKLMDEEKRKLESGHSQKNYQDPPQPVSKGTRSVEMLPRTPIPMLTKTFRCRSPPKIFVPSRQMSLQKNFDTVFKVPLPAPASASVRSTNKQTLLETKDLSSSDALRFHLNQPSGLSRPSALEFTTHPSNTNTAEPEPGRNLCKPGVAVGAVHQSANSDRYLLTMETAMETDSYPNPPGSVSTRPVPPASTTAASGRDSDVGSVVRTNTSLNDVQMQKVTSLAERRVSESRCLDSEMPMSRSFSSLYSAATDQCLHPVPSDVSASLDDQSSSHDSEMALESVSQLIFCPLDQSNSAKLPSSAMTLPPAKMHHNLTTTGDLPFNQPPPSAEAAAFTFPPEVERDIDASVEPSDSEVVHGIDVPVQNTDPQTYAGGSSSPAMTFNFEEEMAKLKQFSGSPGQALNQTGQRLSANSRDFVSSEYSTSPVMVFNFEEEMNKFKKLSESPAANLYSARRMFNQSDSSVPENQMDFSRERREEASGFFFNFGLFGDSQRSNEHEKASSLMDSSFINSFTVSSSSDNKRDSSNEFFSIFGGGGEAEKRSTTNKTISDEVSAMFGSGGGDVQNATRRDAHDESTDAFKMFGMTSTSSSSVQKEKGNAEGFFKFGPSSSSSSESLGQSQFRLF